MKYNGSALLKCNPESYLTDFREDELLLPEKARKAVYLVFGIIFLLNLEPKFIHFILSNDMHIFLLPNRCIHNITYILKFILSLKTSDINLQNFCNNSSYK